MSNVLCFSSFFYLPGSWCDLCLVFWGGANDSLWVFGGGGHGPVPPPLDLPMSIKVKMPWQLHLLFLCLTTNSHLGKLWGGNLKIDQSKNRSMWAELCPYMGIWSIFLSCFTPCYIQTYSNGCRRAHNSKMFFSEEGKIINLLESFWTNIRSKYF